MHRPSRRSFLTMTAAAATTFGLSGGAWSWWSAGYELAPGEVAIGLTPKTFAVARALAEVWAPPSDGLPGGGALALHQRLDEEIWAAPPEGSATLAAALLALEHLPLMSGHSARFSRMALEDRARILEQVDRNDLFDLRVPLRALRSTMLRLWFAQDVVWGGIGYDGPWVGVRKPSASAVRYRELFVAGGGA